MDRSFRNDYRYRFMVRERHLRRTATVAALTAALVGVLGATSVVTAVPAAGVAASPTVDVVAAENFWGDIAAQIGGRDVAVTSLISDPNADPHLFQTDARDAATLARAQVVIENGAGYDAWMGSLLAADGPAPRSVGRGHKIGRRRLRHVFAKVGR